MGRKFARAYYRDELKAKILNPDFKLSIEDDYSKKEIQNITMMKAQ